MHAVAYLEFKERVEAEVWQKPKNFSTQIPRFSCFTKQKCARERERERERERRKRPRQVGLFTICNWIHA